jgi:hypothetical protein
MLDGTSPTVFTLDSESKPIYLNHSLTLGSLSYTTVTNPLYSVFAAKRRRVEDAFDIENKGAENRYSCTKI